MYKSHTSIQMIMELTNMGCTLVELYPFKFHKSCNGEEGISHFMLNRNMWLEKKIQ